jgi:hypothetical protein
MIPLYKINSTTLCRKSFLFRFSKFPHFFRSSQCRREEIRHRSRPLRFCRIFNPSWRGNRSPLRMGTLRRMQTALQIGRDFRNAEFWKRYLPAQTKDSLGSKKKFNSFRQIEWISIRWTKPSDGAVHSVWDFLQRVLIKKIALGSRPITEEIRDWNAHCNCRQKANPLCLIDFDTKDDSFTQQFETCSWEHRLTNWSFENPKREDSGAIRVSCAVTLSRTQKSLFFMEEIRGKRSRCWHQLLSPFLLSCCHCL